MPVGIRHGVYKNLLNELAIRNMIITNEFSQEILFIHIEAIRKKRNINKESIDKNYDDTYNREKKCVISSF